MHLQYRLSFILNKGAKASKNPNVGKTHDKEKRLIGDVKKKTQYIQSNIGQNMEIHHKSL